VQLAELDIVTTIAQIVRDTGIKPGQLTLEITESVIVQDSRTVVSIMNELRSLGIRMAMDDFGTGYSSLASLHRFPINLMKIDRAFVQRSISIVPWRRNRRRRSWNPAGGAGRWRRECEVPPPWGAGRHPDGRSRPYVFPRQSFLAIDAPDRCCIRRPKKRFQESFFSAVNSPGTKTLECRHASTPSFPPRRCHRAGSFRHHPDRLRHVDDDMVRAE
jgi:hypothetical protein